MRTLVPFDARDPNSRLSPVLSSRERREFAAAMLRDVLDAVRGADGDPVVVATTALEAPFEVDTTVVVDDRPLSVAVRAHLDVDSQHDATAVVASDLALATPAALREAFETPGPGDVAAAPGLGGGTNVLVVRHPAFEPDYYGTSFLDHRAGAAAVRTRFHEVDSFRLAVDVDGPGDLPEVLLHGKHRAADWLADAGFSIVVSDGDVRAVRDG